MALVGATGLAVGVGALAAEPGGDAAQAAADVSPQQVAGSEPEADVSTRESVAAEQASRSAVREPLKSVQRADKSKHLSVSHQEMSGGVTKEVAPADPRDIAMAMLPDFGWSSDQFSCLDSLYMHESGWDPLAHNPSSGAHGIPQSLPGDKMAVYGADWYTNPETQLEWGLNYIQDRYGSPCGAWSFWQGNNWY